MARGKKADKITTLQTTAIVVSFMLAAGLLTLPRVATEVAKTPDAWISVILAGGHFPARMDYDQTKFKVSRKYLLPVCSADNRQSHWQRDWYADCYLFCLYSRI